MYANPYHCASSGSIKLATLTASEARANLYRLIDQAAESHQPFTSPASEQALFYCPLRIGKKFKKRSICELFQACANPSRRAWPSLWAKAPRNLTGDRVGTRKQPPLTAWAQRTCPPGCLFHYQAAFFRLVIAASKSGKKSTASSSGKYTSSPPPKISANVGTRVPS